MVNGPKGATAEWEEQLLNVLLIQDDDGSDKNQLNSSKQLVKENLNVPTKTKPKNNNHHKKTQVYVSDSDLNLMHWLCTLNGLSILPIP